MAVRCSGARRGRRLHAGGARADDGGRRGPSRRSAHRPADAAWRDAPVYTAPLILQDMVEPRLLEASTDKVQVRAITDGTRHCVPARMGGCDEQRSPGSRSLLRRVCGAAPGAHAGRCAGAADGRGRSSGADHVLARLLAIARSMVARIRSRPLFPNATVDHYPFEAASLEPGSEAQREMAQRYAPARALGNDMAGPRQRPVQDLIAEGPGTHSSGGRDAVGGPRRARRTGVDAWCCRGRSRPGWNPGGRTQVAFAVWQGAHQEAGARKMRSVWVPL